MQESMEAMKKGLFDYGRVWMHDQPIYAAMDALPMVNPSMQLQPKIVWKLYYDGLLDRAIYDMKPMFSQHPPNPSNLILRDKKVETLEDLKGLKIRGFGKMSTNILAAWGCNPVSLISAELYPSLDRGVIDGLTSYADYAVAVKLWDVSKYWVMDPISAFSPDIGNYLNMDVWNSFPDDIKVIWTELVVEYENKYWAGDLAWSYTKARTELEAGGYEVYHLDPAELQRWKDAQEPVIAAAVKELEDQGIPGQKILDTIREVVDKHGYPGFTMYE